MYHYLHICLHCCRMLILEKPEFDTFCSMCGEHIVCVDEDLKEKMIDYSHKKREEILKDGVRKDQ